MLRIVVIVFLFVNYLQAQLPETDLWLFKIKNEKGILKPEEGKNITARGGYDNQPSFTPDNKAILYVSVRDDKQSDIYRYDLKKGLAVQLTKTKESEYSPGYTPDYKNISCVVVEADSAQRLWLYNPDGTVKKCFNEAIDSIGYYSWLTNDTLLYYKLTEPHSLRIYFEKSNSDKWLCDHPSRAFKKIKNDRFIFAIKDSASIQYRVYNAILKKK